MPEITLKQAQEHNRKNWEKGCKCMACGQTVKLYKRKLNSGMAVFLIKLYHLTRDREYVHASEVVDKNKALDYSVLNLWKLIEASDEVIEGKRQSGYWRITKKGAQFVTGEIDVPKRIHIYNNIVVGFSEDQTTIREALGDKFNYEELMNDVA